MYKDPERGVIFSFVNGLSNTFQIAIFSPPTALSP